MEGARVNKRVATDGTKKASTDIIDLNQSPNWFGERGVKLTPVSLTLPKSLDYDAWRKMVRKVVLVHKQSTWVLADLLNFGEQKYNEMDVQAIELTEYQPEYLAIIKYVARAVDPSRRRQSLSFSHHRLIASLEPKDQDRFLREAERNAWNCEALRQAIRESKGSPLSGNSKAYKTQDCGLKPKVTDTRDEGGFDWRTGEQPEVKRCPTCGQVWPED
jgi:hypothetical protein